MANIGPESRTPRRLPGPSWGYGYADLALVAVLVSELLYLTVTFDTQALDGGPLIVAWLIGWSPQYLRLAITVTFVILLLGGWQLLANRDDAVRHNSPVRYLIAHGCALLLFIRVTRVILDDPRSSSTHPLAWTAAWFLARAATLTAWCLALRPLHVWLRAARLGRHRIFWGTFVGGGRTARQVV